MTQYGINYFLQCMDDVLSDHVLVIYDAGRGVLAFSGRQIAMDGGMPLRKRVARTISYLLMDTTQALYHWDLSRCHALNIKD